MSRYKDVMQQDCKYTWRWPEAKSLLIIIPLGYMCECVYIDMYYWKRLFRKQIPRRSVLWHWSVLGQGHISHVARMLDLASAIEVTTVSDHHIQSRPCTKEPNNTDSYLLKIKIHTGICWRIQHCTYKRAKIHFPCLIQPHVQYLHTLYIYIYILFYLIQHNS